MNQRPVSYARPPSSDGSHRPMPPSGTSDKSRSPAGLSRSSPRRIQHTTAVSATSPSPAHGSDQGSLSGSVRENVYSTGAHGNNKFFWNRKSSLSGVSEGGGSSTSHYHSPQSGSRKVQPLDELTSPMLSRSTLSQINAPYGASVYVLHTPKFQRGNKEFDEKEVQCMQASSVSPRSHSSSGSIELPHEQEAAERPVLFHRVERWLKDDAFSLEIDDFELKSGQSTNDMIRRPGTAQPTSAVYGGGGISSNFALRYRRTVESYSKQNGAHHATSSRAIASSVDDMGFDSMLPMATRQARSEAGMERVRPSSSGSQQRLKVDAAAAQRQLLKKKATERLWRSRIGQKGDGSDASDSDSGVDSSLSD